MKKIIFIVLMAIICFSDIIKGQNAVRPLSVGNDSAQYGVCIVKDGKKIGAKMDKAFAMHSVMKFPQALYVAEYLRTHSMSLEDSILIRKNELKQDTWSPMLAAFNGERYFSYAELLELSLEQSDNNACDVLFKHIGSPKQVENYIHGLGYYGINIKLTESEMAKNPALSSENNSTPSDMAGLFMWFFEHKDDSEYLSFIWKTMGNCKTGADRLPAIMPKGASIVHKTGTGFTYPDNTKDRNDAGVIVLPDGSYMAIVVFTSHSHEEQELARVAKTYIDK